MESDEMRWSMDKSLSLGMPMSPQEISKRYKHQILGMPPRHPFFIGKNQVTFQDTIFLLLHILCVFLGVSLLLLLVFFCFICCNKWLDPNKFLLEKMHSIFHLIDSTRLQSSWSHKDHSMGERDEHIATGRALSLGGELLRPYHGS
jgi:hypothetical protein